MDAKLLQRVMDLAEKTGDRVIIVNPKSGNAHAILPFDSYENLVANKASLRDLEDDFVFSEDSGDGDDDCLVCRESEIDLNELDEIEKGEEGMEQATFLKKGIVREEPMINPVSPAEVHAPVQKPQLDVEKISELSQKDVDVAASLDILEDEENEEQYYLEPLE
jgi:hypothetical protein